MAKVDLLIGGDLGAWSLDNVAQAEVGTVFTVEPSLYELAKSKGFAASLSDVNVAPGNGQAALSIHYPKILSPATLGHYRRVYNLHPGYLPWGRGFYPIFWSLWEGSPAGATLHEMDAGLDTGAIVSQIRVEATAEDTGGSLFQRVREAEKKLFLEFFPKLSQGETPAAVAQGQGGSYHSRQEFFDLKNSFDWRKEKPEDVNRLSRCLTFPGYPGLKPLLSICLPTYQGGPYIAEQLEALLPQVKKLSEWVELCLCDDHSTDGTWDVVLRQHNKIPFRIERNAERLTSVTNFHNLITAMASGEYVWLLGQDDLVAPDALERIVSALRANSEIDAFYLNYHFRLPCSQAHSAGEAPAEHFHESLLKESHEDQRVERWQDLIQSDGWLGTGMGMNILRRKLWLDYWKANPPAKDFTWTGTGYPNCNPHSYLIADYCLNRPAYFIAKPVMTLTGGTAVWHESRNKVFQRWYPHLLNHFKKRGLTTSAYRHHARWVYDLASWTLREELNQTPRSMAKVGLNFLREHPLEWHAWRAVGKAVKGCDRLAPVKRFLRGMIQRKGAKGASVVAPADSVKADPTRTTFIARR